MGKIKLAVLMPLFGLLLRALKPDMVRDLFTAARQWIADRAAATETDYDDKLLEVLEGNPEVVRELADFLLDRIEDLIAATPTNIDDVLVGTLVSTIRAALDIPDND